MLAAGVAQAQTDGKPQDPAATGPLIQLEKAYADFPVDVPTAGKQLKLNGSALCEWGVLGFDLYRGALYAERPSKDANALMTVDQTLMVYLYFVRSLSSSQLQDAFRASAHYQVGKESPLESQLQTLLGWMRDVKKGDALAFVASPQGALKGFYNGQPLGTIESPDFTKLFVKLYLGNKPPTEALKKGMLGA
ncbi:MAG TPA: chalcone isomerase family protein [Planctomycetota bacterium]|nr:chalcone isomerase family protein [Planctomycetota bacterium]